MVEIRLLGVSKEFSRNGRTFLANHLASLRRSSNSDRFLALEDINLTISGPGKQIGIIGSNGSGKTTLLRIIAGVTRPTRGKVLVKGRGVPLLELGTRPQLDLTAREAIYLNGISLGMSRREVRRKFDSITEFAGLSRFLDMPLAHYSCGMIVRLSFSVAIHVEGEILLVDEAWGIGDDEFQAKSLEKIQQLQAKGVIALIVSHDLEMIRQLTDETLWLERGRIACWGPTDSVLEAYRSRSMNSDLRPVYA